VLWERAFGEGNVEARGFDEGRVALAGRCSGSAELFGAEGDVGVTHRWNWIGAGGGGVGIGIAGDEEIGRGGGGGGDVDWCFVLGGAGYFFCAGDAGVDAGVYRLLFRCHIRCFFCTGDWGVAGDAARSAAGGA